MLSRKFESRYKFKTVGLTPCCLGNLRLVKFKTGGLEAMLYSSKWRISKQTHVVNSVNFRLIGLEST